MQHNFKNFKLSLIVFWAVWKKKKKKNTGLCLLSK